MTRKNADQVMAELLKIKRTGLDIQDFLKHIVHEFNGPVGFAQDVRRVFMTANPGSQTQARIISDLLRLLATSGGTAAADDDMEPDEIEGLVKELLSDDEDYDEES